MAEGNGDFVKLNRKMLEWEWYKNEHTKSVFIHCLLKAYWRDTKYQGGVIKRGSFHTTYPKLSNELDLTEREIRTAIAHLKSTGELSVKTTNKYSIITVNNYELYQLKDSQNDSQVSGKSQSIVSPLSAIEEYKEDKKIKEYNISSSLHSVVDAWNSLSEYGIKPISKLTSGTKRYDSLVARLNQYGLDDVLKAIENIKHSDFLQGRVNSKRQWVITFDWFVLPNNFPKVLEGQYGSSNTSSTTDLDPQITAQLRALEEQQLASMPDVANMSDEDIDRLIRGEL